MSNLCLQNALQVAKGTYHEDGLKIDFMAVSALNDALVEAVGLHKDRIEGIPLPQLEDALSAVLTRHQHSEEFYMMVEEGRRFVIHAIQQDRRVLADLKNWDILSRDERINGANHFTGIVRDIFVSHIELPPDTRILARAKHDTHTAAIDYSTFGIIVPVQREPDVGGRYAEEILIDTDHERFQDGYVTYAAIYMDYLRLIESSLPKGNMRGKFGQTIDRISHDVELCRVAYQEDAFVNSLLKDLSLYHFSNMLRHVEGKSMANDLEKTVERYGQDIPVYERPSFREKLNMFLGGKGLHL